MTYKADKLRYESMIYRKAGKNGLRLPVISLGLWQNFGGENTLETQREMLHTAFDLGITHFDLANNYGTPYGSAELNFGKIFHQDLRQYRDEIIISTKAGYDMWPGPYGQKGSSRKYLLASLDQSLKRLKLDYVDIFYSHCFDKETPLEETAGALASAVTQGKTLYVGISSYPSSKTIEIANILSKYNIPLLVNQSSYNMFNRWIELKLLNICEKYGVGIIAFSTLAQGLLTKKYSNHNLNNMLLKTLSRSTISPTDLSIENLTRIKYLEKIAKKRNQTLAQMALSWVLRDTRITSTLIGASSCTQIRENVDILKNLTFNKEELIEIDSFAIDGSVNFGRQQEI